MNESGLVAERGQLTCHGIRYRGIRLGWIPNGGFSSVWIVWLETKNKKEHLLLLFVGFWIGEFESEENWIV